MNTSHWKAVLCISGSVVMCGVAYKFYKNYTKKLNSDLINEVLIYGGDNEGSKSNQLCISYLIMHASKSVDICVPSLTSEKFAECLIKLRLRNMADIRIIVHSSGDNEQLKFLAENGVGVKIGNLDEPIEHEFIIIDATENISVALSGFLAYEEGQENRNRAATMLTSNRKAITALMKEFERVWESIIDYVHDANE